jgi:HEAT repeat protein
MVRFLMIFVFVGGLYYLYVRRNTPPEEPPPPPPALLNTPAPVMSPEEIEKVRMATKDSDPQVRWAAIELLNRIHDPQAPKILEEMMAIDTESSVRQNALGVLKSSNDPKKLVAALKDSEKGIRLAALMALGDIGDPSVTPDIVAMMNDVEPEIRLQSIQALGHIQERRIQEYQQQQQKLKEEYEKALQRSKFQPLSGDGKFFDKTKKLNL